jgi:hypothetical protein
VKIASYAGLKMYSADGNLQGILELQTNSEKSQQKVVTLVALLMRLPFPS